MYILHQPNLCYYLTSVRVCVFADGVFSSVCVFVDGVFYLNIYYTKRDICCYENCIVYSVYVLKQNTCTVLFLHILKCQVNETLLLKEQEH